MITESIEGFDIEIPIEFAKYKLISKIGTGSYSVVYQVMNKNTKQRFACKIVSREQLVSEQIFDRFEQEVRVMSTFNHPNIVKIEDIIFSDKLIYLIMELCERGELFTLIADTGGIYEPEMKKIARQVVEALVYLHSRNIAHRDLKPENILLDEHMNAKLADFGLCHAVSDKYLLRTPCGSPFYAPPEIIKNVPYDGKKCDMWSLGVVLFTMVTGNLPWSETNQYAILEQIVTADYIIPLSVSPTLRKLIYSLMTPDPTLRPTAEEILQCEWLTQLDDEMKKDLIRLQFQKRKEMRANDIVKSTVFRSVKKPMIVRPSNHVTGRITHSMDFSTIKSIRKVPKSALTKNKNTISG